MLILDGKAVALKVKLAVQKRAQNWAEKRGRPLGLAVVLVGEDPASQVYVKNKIKSCEEVGVRSFEHRLPAQTTEAELCRLIKNLNEHPEVDAILVQMPLPPHISSEQVLDVVSPAKDADGLTLTHLGALVAGAPRIRPCTPAGVIEILNHYQIPIAGRSAVVIGRSRIVGQPMALLLTHENATVTVAHSKTEDLKRVVSAADIVVVAAGQPRKFGREYFKKGAVVVDVGIHRTANGLCGDVIFEELDSHVSAATPVPGGVGVMTIAMLLKNTADLAELRLL